MKKILCWLLNHDRKRVNTYGPHAIPMPRMIKEGEQFDAPIDKKYYRKSFMVICNRCNERLC